MERFCLRRATISSLTRSFPGPCGGLPREARKNSDRGFPRDNRRRVGYRDAGAMASGTQPLTSVVFCGRKFPPREIRLIAEVVDSFGGLSRLELALTVCELLG